MARQVPVDQVESVLKECSFPIVRSDAAVELSDVVVINNSREYNLGEVISDANSDTYQTVEDLLEDIHKGIDKEEQ